MNEAFVQGVADTLREGVEQGWPARGGAWLVERNGRLEGSLGLTAEGDGTGKLCWVVLAPALRGTGLGRRMISQHYVAHLSGEVG